MLQIADTETTHAPNGNLALRAEKRTNQTLQEAPALLTKKWLCHHFGLVSAGTARYNYKKLYRAVLTVRVIRAIGMTERQVRRRTFREFDAERSALLKNILQL